MNIGKFNSYKTDDGMIIKFDYYSNPHIISKFAILSLI